MHRLAKIKYPATEGCLNYLTMRANWIEHWVKAIQSGLVNTLTRGMAHSYTDLVAQHAGTRVENLKTLTSPPVPQGAAIFTSGRIAHPAGDAFPPYLQPELPSIEKVCPTEVVTTDARTVSVAISPSSSRSQGSRGLAEIQRRNLLVMPPRGPVNRLPSEQTEKKTEEYESTHGNLASSGSGNFFKLTLTFSDSGSRFAYR